MMAGAGLVQRFPRPEDRKACYAQAWARTAPQNAASRVLHLAASSQNGACPAPFVSRANERYLRGEVLSTLGRDAEALQWFASLCPRRGGAQSGGRKLSTDSIVSASLADLS